MAIKKVSEFKDIGIRNSKNIAQKAWDKWGARIAARKAEKNLRADGGE